MCVLKRKKNKKRANLKTHAYSDVKVGQLQYGRCFRVFQLYSSVTHFVLRENSTGRGFICFTKDSFQHELLASDKPLRQLSRDMHVETGA